LSVEYLTETIEVLKHGREKLINDVISRNRYDIYKWLFQHEKNQHGQRLVFEKYFIEWINSQLEEAFAISNAFGCQMVKRLSPLIEEKASLEKESAVVIKGLVPQLLSEKVKILKNFMYVEDLNESRLNELRFMLEKDNALFNRYLEEMDGSS